MHALDPPEKYICLPSFSGQKQPCLERSGWEDGGGQRMLVVCAGVHAGAHAGLCAGPAAAGRTGAAHQTRASQNRTTWVASHTEKGSDIRQTLEPELGKRLVVK